MSLYSTQRANKEMRCNNERKRSNGSIAVQFQSLHFRTLFYTLVKEQWKWNSTLEFVMFPGAIL